MRLKQVIAIILCVAILLAAFVGCSDADAEETDEYEDGAIEVIVPETEEGESNDEHSPGIDFDTAILAFAPDTVMMRADDLTLSWADLYVFLFNTIISLAQSYQTSIDWSEELNAGSSLADLVLEHSTEEALSLLVWLYGAQTLDVSLSDDDLEMMKADIDSLIDMYGSKEELESALRERNGFYSIDVFERRLIIEHIMRLVMSELYGEEAASYPDESVSEYVQSNGFMMAKHILRLITEEEDDTPLREIEDLLKQLNEHIGDDDFEAFFDALMHEHSEDPGALMFPQGYLFQHSDMVVAFSDACAALEIGEFSEIVPTEYGYHIILRLPLDYELVPYSLAASDMHLTLRQLAAIEDFEELLQTWRNEMNIVFTSDYQSIDIATIFAWRDS